MDFEAALWRPDARGAATFVTLPFDVKALFGRARCPVRVTINDHTWRTTTQVYGDDYHIVVSAQARSRRGDPPGDAVRVQVKKDDTVRATEVPPELAAGCGPTRRRRTPSSPRPLAPPRVRALGGRGEAPADAGPPFGRSDASGSSRAAPTPLRLTATASDTLPRCASGCAFLLPSHTVPVTRWRSDSRWRTRPATFAILVARTLAVRHRRGAPRVVRPGQRAVDGPGPGHELPAARSRSALATFLVSVIVLLLWIPLRERPGLGTISNAVVIALRCR